MFGKKKTMTTAALAALAAAGGTAVMVVDAHAQSTPTIQPMSGAPEIRDGQQRFKVRGRFQYDLYSNDWDIGVDNGSRSYVRRAFLGVQGRFTDRWRYKVDFVLSPGANDASTSLTTTTIADCNAVLAGPQPCIGTISASTTGGGDDVGVDDAYLEYAGDFFSFVIGENNITSPLEDRTSSLDTPFVERSSLVNTFGYGRAGGAAFLLAGANWMGAVGVYGDSINNQDTNFASDEQTAISGRFTWAPFFEVSPEGYGLLHLGVSARQRYQGDDSAYRYRARPLNGRGNRHIDAGSAVAGQDDTTLAFEVAGQYNAFGFQGEYAQLSGQTPGEVEFDYDAYYFDVYWSLTGEARSYRGNQGSFGPIVPRNPVSEGGWGHWMLSARYDYIDLSDPAGGLAGSSRGEQTSYVVGLDWIPIDHVRFKLNYAQSDMDRTASPASVDDEAQVITLRTQFDF